MLTAGIAFLSKERRLWENKAVLLWTVFSIHRWKELSWWSYNDTTHIIIGLCSPILLEKEVRFKTNRDIIWGWKLPLSAIGTSLLPSICFLSRGRNTGSVNLPEVWTDCFRLRLLRTVIWQCTWNIVINRKSVTWQVAKKT